MRADSKLQPLLFLYELSLLASLLSKKDKNEHWPKMPKFKRIVIRNSITEDAHGVT